MIPLREIKRKEKSRLEKKLIEDFFARKILINCMYHAKWKKPIYIMDELEKLEGMLK